MFLKDKFIKATAKLKDGFSFEDGTTAKKVNSGSYRILRKKN